MRRMQVGRTSGNETQDRPSSAGLLRVNDVAEMLGTSAGQVRNMITRGQLVAPLRVPGLGLRWRAEVINAWLDGLDCGGRS